MTPAQKLALDQLMPRYGIPDEGVIESKNIFGRQAPTTIEIGFGNGETLLQLAKMHPQRNYIGIEVHRPGVGRLLQAIESEGLSNLRVSTDDAVEFLESRLSIDSLDELLLYFPDPWHKKRHHKRRIVSPAFAKLVASRLAPCGRWYLATDWENYAEYMLEVIESEPALRNIAGAGKLLGERSHRPESHFERRGLRRGHLVFDLGYEKVSTNKERSDV